MIWDAPDTWSDDDFDLCETDPGEWPAWAQDEYLHDEDDEDDYPHLLPGHWPNPMGGRGCW